MVIPSQEFDGPRLMRLEDIRPARRLSRLCFGGIDTEEYDEPVELMDPRWGSTYVTAHKNVPVSMISIFHNQIKLYDGRIRLGSIGGVCTHPDFRGLGLAGTLLDHCTRQLRLEGACLMLISGGRGLYTRVGCVPTGKYLQFTLRPGQIAPASARLRLRPASRADARLCGMLNQAENVHFVRPVEKFEHNLGHPGGYIHSDEWIVERSGQPVAYILLGKEWEQVGNRDRGLRSVREYAGSRTALVEAMGQIMALQGLKEVEWPVSWQDGELIHLFQERSLSGQWTYLSDHTMRIINFPGLMADLQTYVRSRLDAKIRRGLRFEQSGPLLGPDTGDCFVIRRGKDRLELDGAAMTFLVMGDPLRPPEKQVQAPGALAEVVSALFPLPSFLPGLNYQ